MSLLVLGFILLLQPLCGIHANKEGDVLYWFMKSIEDPNDAIANWDNFLVNPSTWWRVVCNQDNSVIKINLGRQGLSGLLSADLGKLKNLQHMLLNDNNMSGPIHNEFGKLGSLLDLDLHNNILNGSVPDSLGNLSKLLYLRLQGNKLTGNIPTSLSKLQNLLVLLLTLPLQEGFFLFLTLPQLIYCSDFCLNRDLSNNKISGQIPAELAGLPKLRYLNLSNNQLQGKLPAAFAKTQIILDVTNNPHLIIGKN
ncbi:protein kinase superfamily [Castilleja foliolosa]|uniref:Protein kinase superfamily n=1 Tax=Castilleja foliolosa TaxID=1961234 RepID=A0ABD3BQH9_9LAMI